MRKHTQQVTVSLLRLAGLLFLSAGILVGAKCSALAAEALNEPLDTVNPVYFYGDRVTYQDEIITLDSYNIYLDGSLSDAVCDKYEYVYNDYVEAYKAGAIVSGTESRPMNVWIAPNVYWMDDWTDPAIRDGVNGDSTPYALWMDVNYLSLNGLTEDPENVVFAVDRGHGAGATGNYTMFFINGTGTHTENMTFGNYCCVDLVYPLDETKNHPKRQTAITQSQLILTNGSKITAENCHFDSRLNSCPFVGGDRILFTDCHFECTDDSLPTGAVYVNCDFEFYSGKPFYSTSGTGSVMLGCKFYIMHGSNQYLTKAGGIVNIIDSTFYSTRKDQYIGWTPDPATSLRCYEGDVSVVYDYKDADGNDQHEENNHYIMDADAPYVNVDITGTSAMNAYCIENNGKKIYNVYNLLKGTDDWDPLNQKELLMGLQNNNQENYTDVPVILTCSPSSGSMVDGTTKKVSTNIKAFTGNTSQGKNITWKVEEKLKDYISVEDNGDGSCTLTCKNKTINVVQGMVYAVDTSGLSAGIFIKASPETMDAPTFQKKPSILVGDDGIARVQYELSYEGLEDYSDITWYRSSDPEGTNKIKVAVTERDMPLKAYPLTYGDIGYYLIAQVTPKQQCTYAGTMAGTITTAKIVKENVTADPYHMQTDFSDIAYSVQTLMLPGFWMSDTYKDWIADGDRYPNATPWTYGVGPVSYGDEGLYGLLPISKGARMVYTPVKGSYGDMKLTLVVNPEKTAGQGFGSATPEQHMIVYIKYDVQTMTGYGLYLERYNDCGIYATLASFKDGVMTKIGDTVKTSAFNAECTIDLEVKGNILSATMTTTKSQSEKQINAGLAHQVNVSAEITENTYGGLGFIFTGSVPAGNRVMFNQLSVTWDDKTSSIDIPTGEVLAGKDIAKADITVPSAVKYTGDPLTPEVSVTYQGQKLELYRDYSVSYENNIVIGTATVKVKGKGNYAGVVEKTFLITAEDPASQNNGNTQNSTGTPDNANPQNNSGAQTPVKQNTAAKAPKKGDTFTVKGIRYQVTSDAKGKCTVTVAGTSKKTIKNLVIGATVTYKGVTYKITAVKAGAYKGLSKLAEVTIGKNIKTIGKNAFYNCKNLKKVTIKSTVIGKSGIGSKAFGKLNSKLVCKVPSGKYKAYVKYLKKAGITGKKQTIKK